MALGGLGNPDDWTGQPLFDLVLGVWDRLWMFEDARV